MNRSAARRQLRLEGVFALSGLLLLPLLAGFLGDSVGNASPVLGVAAFVLGLLLLFPSLPGFRRYKHALIATERAFDSPREVTAWAVLRSVRRRGLVLAALPAAAAALGVFVGTEPAARLLLTLGSVTLWWLYRVPKQLR